MNVDLHEQKRIIYGIYSLAGQTLTGGESLNKSRWRELDQILSPRESLASEIMAYKLHPGH